MARDLTVGELMLRLEKLDPTLSVFIMSDDPYYRSVGAPKKSVLVKDGAGDVVGHGRGVPFEAVVL